MFILFISSKTSSFQRVLGLPIGLLDVGFRLLIFCTILSSAMCSTWPNQFNLCFLINPIIFCPFNISIIAALDTPKKLAVLFSDAPAKRAPTICPLQKSNKSPTLQYFRTNYCQTPSSNHRHWHFTA